MTINLQMRVITQCLDGGRVDFQSSFPKWLEGQMVEIAHFSEGFASSVAQIRPSLPIVQICETCQG